MKAAIIAEVLLGLIPSAWFVARYGLGSPWWRTPMGRHLMALSASLAGLFGLLALAWVTGPLPPIVWVIALAALDLALWWRVLLLHRAQRGDRPTS